ncbi:MAG: hypothetical protein QOI10_1509 [Solirubrobacterales bacterium]|jgi:glycosyltransferase involved in cell wall biosynthesis|nr:hypothetical protein [Solirubrobacterales bacterium]
MATPLRVVQVSTGLETGGAETMLERLVDHLDAERIESVVVSLTTAGVIGPRLRERGVEVIECRAGGLPGPISLARIRGALRRVDADVVQTWAIYANVLGGVGARLAGPAPIAWGVHHAGDDLAAFGRKLVITQKIERRLSFRLPARIVACSQSSARMMEELHYPGDRVVTIPNGFETERFRPDAEARERTRGELGIRADELVVGHVARFHPVKGHAVMAAAAVEVAERLPAARFVLCGAGVDEGEPLLASLAARLGDRALLLGERADMERLYPAFDVCVSSSLTEALPLAVGEAMACAVVVAATDCGDSAAIVGDTGRIVATGDAAALAAGIAELLELGPAERARLGEAARARISDRYSMAAMAGAYSRLWAELDSASRRS